MLDNEAVCDGARELIDALDSMGSSDRAAYQPSEKLDPMWKDVVWLVKNAPRHFFRVNWIPSHLMDNGKERQLKAYLDDGGCLEMAKGNFAADALANAGADLAAPPASVLTKDKFVQLLAKKVQVMQILVWSAFKGYIASDLEIEATKLSGVVNENPSDWDDPWLEVDDPALEMFLAQCDGLHQADYDDPHEVQSTGMDSPFQQSLVETDLRSVAENGASESVPVPVANVLTRARRIKQTGANCQTFSIRHGLQ
jgi:hypothetical protein